MRPNGKYERFYFLEIRSFLQSPQVQQRHQKRISSVGQRDAIFEAKGLSVAVSHYDDFRSFFKDFGPFEVLSELIE